MTCFLPHLSTHTPYLSTHFSLYLNPCLLIHSFDKYLESVAHVPGTLFLHPSFSSRISLHVSSCLPIFLHCFPPQASPSAHLFPPPHISPLFSPISLWVKERAEAGQGLTSSLWGPITPKCSRQKSVVPPATRRKEKRLRHKHLPEPWEPPAVLESASSASSTSRIMLSVLMASSSEGLKSSWETVEPCGWVC